MRLLVERIVGIQTAALWRKGLVKMPKIQLVKIVDLTPSFKSF